MEQTSLSIFSAMRWTTWSSFDWADPRLAITSWRPVRISRAEVAAEWGIEPRLSDGTRACHATMAVRLSGSAVPAGRFHPIRFILHLSDILFGNRLVEQDSCFLAGAPDDLGETLERANNDQHVFVGHRQVAAVEESAFGRQVGNNHRA